jgi:NADPH:quinone reductase-like Zn-dependent oxidoreductase
LDDLNFKLRPRRAPGEREVEVRIAAAGLNFRDVLNALGQYPADAGLLGFEAVGTVVRVGVDVIGLHPGETVIVLTPGCIGSHVTADQALVLPKPERMTIAEAVTLPAAFLTAHYALNVLGKMRAGDRVLIHAGAGGVGLAAIQLAQRAGAEIFATVGSTEKREYLETIGLKHIMSSRNTDFAAEIRKRAPGGAVDLVLNSLTGEFIPANLSVLAPRGRFLEMGKIGIWDEARVRAIDPSFFYRPFDLAEVLKSDPGFIRSMFNELAREFVRSCLRPLPHTIFSLDQAEEAFRFMAQARHIGKVVLSRESEARRERIASDGLVAKHASYLVTGGLGALGLHVARWLASEGARHLVLVGRRNPDERAAGAIEAMRADGADITIANVDVSSATEVAGLVDRIGNHHPPLRGIVHAAGVLDDGMLAELSRERFRSVMLPKVWGAWNLHQATLHENLDFFVMFSSVAAVIGNLGQANYAAANGFMDGLASQRRRLGLPATSINWGPFADMGMAAKPQTDRFSAQGLGLLAPETGPRLLADVLVDDLENPCIVQADWNKYVHDRGLRPGQGLFAAVATEAGSKAAMASAAPARDIRAELGQALPVQRPAMLRAYLLDLARETLGYGESEPLALDQPLVVQGFDSLMSVDMRNRLNRSLGCTLPASLLFDYPTLDKIADYLLATVVRDDDPVSEDVWKNAAGSAEAILREIECLVAS